MNTRENEEKQQFERTDYRTTGHQTIVAEQREQ